MLSPYDVARQGISTVYVVAHGNNKIGYWVPINDLSESISEKSDLKECASKLTIENSGEGAVNPAIASAQLVNCMRQKGWELKFEQLML